MRFDPERKVETYAYAARGLIELEADHERRLKYLDFIDIYAHLDDNERERYQREYPDKGEIMSSFSERFIQQGEEIGVRKGEAKVLLNLLQLKFGEVPQAFIRRIDEANASALLQWSGAVLTANRLEDVFQD